MRERVQRVTHGVAVAFRASRRSARMPRGFVSHMFKTRNPKREALEEELKADLLPQVGKVPISQLEEIINERVGPLSPPTPRFFY